MADQALFDVLRAWDANGNAAPGATATFYASGTLSLISVYADADATTLSTNPVSADANGVFPQRYVSEQAKAIIRDSGGVTLYELDPVPMVKTAFGSASSVSFSPTSFVPMTDVQAAIEAVDTNARARDEATTDALGDLSEDDLADYQKTEAVWIAGTDTGDAFISPARLRGIITRGWGGVPAAILEDQKASGTFGGTRTSGSWETRDLNTEVRDPLGIVTLAANVFTVTADAWCEWLTTFSSTNESASRIYNVTDAAVAGRGTIARPPGGGNDQSEGGCALIAGKSYRLESRVLTTAATTGGGLASSFQTEVYTRIRIWLT